MTQKALSPGDTIDARCSKCKAVTNHTLIALVGEAPAKVQCNTCGGSHKYRTPVEKKKPSETVTKAPARKPRTRKTDPQTAAKIEWETTIHEFDAEKAVPYAMDNSYKIGCLVNHPTFGLGVVKTVPGGRKVEILFKDGLKLLRCG